MPDKTPPRAAGLTLFPIPHVAVSSQLYWHRYMRYVSEEMEELLAGIARADKA